MTEENQNTGSETPETKSEFLGGETTETSEPSFDKSEIEKLAKMNSDAQTFINQLKTETAEMRSQIKGLQEELSKSKTIDDLIDNYGQQTSEPGPKTPPVNEQELLAKLKADVFAELSATDQKAREEKNWQDALAQAEAKFGEGYGNYVDARAKELNISVEDMRSYAKTSPNVFMELLGEKQAGTPPPTQGTQQPPSSAIGDDVKVRYAKYVRVRRESTPEGAEARRMLADQDFMDLYRKSILSS